MTKGGNSLQVEDAPDRPQLLIHPPLPDRGLETRWQAGGQQAGGRLPDHEAAAGSSPHGAGYPRVATHAAGKGQISPLRRWSKAEDLDPLPRFAHLHASTLEICPDGLSVTVQSVGDLHEGPSLDVEPHSVVDLSFDEPLGVDGDTSSTQVIGDRAAVDSVAECKGSHGGAGLVICDQLAGSILRQVTL